MYLLAQNNTVQKYPYSLQELRKDNPQVMFPKEPSAALLASYGVYEVVKTDVVYAPSSQVIAEDDPVLVDGTWFQHWSVRNKTPEELSREYDNALTDHLDSVAQARRYDNRITCALRAGYAGPYHDECAAFAIWMDTCNSLAYGWMQEIAAGTRPMFASTDEMIAALPVMVWPD